MLNSPALWITVAVSATWFAFSFASGRLEFLVFFIVAVVAWIRFVASSIRFLRSGPWNL